MFEYDKHYRKCQQFNKPFIKARINPKHGNYLVNIDMMTCDYNFSSEEIKELYKLVGAATSLGSDSFSIGKEMAWFDGILPDSVDSFCVKLYDLTQRYHS